METYQIALRKGQNARQVVGNFLRDAVHSAIELIEAHGNREIIKLFDKKSNFLSRNLLWKRELIRPNLDYAFCEPTRNDSWVLIPSSNSIGIVL